MNAAAKPAVARYTLHTVQDGVEQQRGGLVDRDMVGLMAIVTANGMIGTRRVDATTEIIVRRPGRTGHASRYKWSELERRFIHVSGAVITNLEKMKPAPLPAPVKRPAEAGPSVSTAQLREMLLRHDWWYNMADDPNAHHAGKVNADKLRAYLGAERFNALASQMTSDEPGVAAEAAEARAWIESLA